MGSGRGRGTFLLGMCKGHGANCAIDCPESGGGGMVGDRDIGELIGGSEKIHSCCLQ